MQVAPKQQVDVDDIVDDECKEVDEDDECKASNINMMGDYVVGIDVLDMPCVENDDDDHHIIQKGKDYEYPIYPLCYAIFGSIIIVVVSFASL